MSVGGGEFRVLLLRHFGHILFYHVLITEKSDVQAKVKTTHHPPFQRQLRLQRFTSSSFHVHALKTMKRRAFYVSAVYFYFCIPIYILKEAIFKDFFAYEYPIVSMPFIEALYYFSI